MAIFNRKTATKSKAAPKKEKKTGVASTSERNLSAVLKAPRITEKAMRKSEGNVYTFEVARTATKYDVRDAVKALYNVTPLRVNIVNKTPRQYKVRSRGRMATEHGIKKAYVYLKEGDSISLI